MLRRRRLRLIIAGRFDTAELRTSAHRRRTGLRAAVTGAGAV
ncbi:hypothetical protein ACIBL8_07120 [Streptomyces sp. NPDC050523]